MTIIFLVVCATLLPFSLFYRKHDRPRSCDHDNGARGAARLPDSTTIGGLLSAIGIAGMDA